MQFIYLETYNYFIPKYVHLLNISRIFLLDNYFNIKYFWLFNNGTVILATLW